MFNEMQMFAKICRRSKSNLLSFRCENTYL